METEELQSSPQAFAGTVQQDYWGFYAQSRFILPDGVSYIEFRLMNEGDKVKFQRSTGRDIILQRSGDAKMRMDPGTERHTLIKTVATGWNFVRNGELVMFTPRNLDEWLDLADPRIVEDLEKAIRKENPWLLSDMKAVDIQKEIDNLTEMLEVAKEREAGEGVSSNR